MVNKIGQIGEDIATKLLEDKGYKILERNFRTKIGEMDIIAEQNDTIVFVEVKARTSTLYGLPQESITKRKLARLQKLAYLYLIQKNIQSKHFRIDVISIQLDKAGNIKKIEHIKEVE